MRSSIDAENAFEQRKHSLKTKTLSKPGIGVHFLNSLFSQTRNRTFS